MPHVYMLRCADGSYYVGSTRDLQKRLQQHATGLGSRYTSSRMPVELVWSQETETIPQAYALEKQVQGWSRAKREALIADQWDVIVERSRRRGGRPLVVEVRRPPRPEPRNRAAVVSRLLRRTSTSEGGLGG
ncbi:GIY-YIG nuclease family protein [Janibacter melonis]|uniref:GIY-YIG nuclease family protein n=1 Tax=Janibacter melonis TaxID=262209 RepID=UPI0017480826|nr:GIY-YIG nuclease family protein [Janibacter melonis]